MKKDGLSTQSIYELIDRKINEVNLSITRLEAKFDSLEAGRLSMLEKEFANLKGELQGKMAIVAGGISVIISIISIFINKWI